MEKLELTWHYTNKIVNDLIKIFQQYGAYNAANLDGGSSTELYVKGKIKNTPVGGGKDGLRKMPIYWVVK